MRKIIIAGNWKLNKKPKETVAFVEDIWKGLEEREPACEVIVCPPFISAPVAAASAEGTAIRVGTQNIFWEDEGAFTGEVSGPMIKDAGCSHAIIGHSERRQYFGETNETVKRRIEAALRNDLVPIFCLGETLEEREDGKTSEVVETQLREGLGDLRPHNPERFVLAYEPVWAIGTGKTATPEQAQEVHAFLREQLGKLLGTNFAENVRILYGGSMKPNNAKALTSRPDIDGGLIGGASLKVDDFIGIIAESCTEH